uniref:Uncharacterized protein TCIL3000_1_1290 n=1 Tax=Trypanosoma congolense (strain IL3000) TaxID=1068625 RepID=G0UJ11_TRYCI|nr:unnamed protein product [Trypanosoma congolense IL3000]
MQAGRTEKRKGTREAMNKVNDSIPTDRYRTSHTHASTCLLLAAPPQTSSPHPRHSHSHPLPQEPAEGGHGMRHTTSPCPMCLLACAYKEKGVHLKGAPLSSSAPSPSHFAAGTHTGVNRAVRARRCGREHAGAIRQRPVRRNHLRK